MAVAPKGAAITMAKTVIARISFAQPLFSADPPLSVTSSSAAAPNAACTVALGIQASPTNRHSFGASRPPGHTEATAAENLASPPNIRIAIPFPITPGVKLSIDTAAPT
eukprot:CAMPEP_0196584126 /NCGR_PEP_ID=MMETSP1081-20130531/45854_1 /TAXON_ID=36882 /ORGANISM="Pyramimonas amylifera, Strain CCMP720" /LENGTH=108 /DNA_ID=CAMNT_0041905229 /DNA_START=121 /DNA_END=443 /DNA_ORIENTATION=-